MQQKSRPGALRGLALVFVLSFLSLIGVMLTIAAVGGLGAWTRWQFIGLFGLLECAGGAANIILPNVWRLPVAEAQTKRSTKICLAPSVLLIPHWAAAARIAAGTGLVAGALVVEGATATSLALLPLMGLLAWLMIGASLIVARAGVAWPRHDVVQLVIVRPHRRIELPPISIGASIVQFVLSIATIPLVKVLPPSVLYQPAFAPSWAMMVAVVVASAATLLLAAWAWQGRLDWRAPAAQHRDAKRYA